MLLRPYQSSDARETMALFYHTVHTINIRDYTKDQVDVWAPLVRDEQSWNKSFLNHYSLVVVEENQIIGFGDISDEGYLDRFYIHHLWQGKGVGKLLLTALEDHVTDDITTHASITAKPFFEKQGYVEMNRQTVEINGVKMDNFVMIKKR